MYMNISVCMHELAIIRFFNQVWVVKEKTFALFGATASVGKNRSFELHDQELISSAQCLPYEYKFSPDVDHERDSLVLIYMQLRIIYR